MKLLRIKIEGYPLFQDPLDIALYATKRVTEEEGRFLQKLCHVGNSCIYLNPANVFVGINASGKTTILELLNYVMNLMSGHSINLVDSWRILKGADHLTVTTWYSNSNNELCCLETEIQKNNGDFNKPYVIQNECLWKKKPNSSMTKRNFLDFSNIRPALKRNDDETYLPSDISIIIAENKRNHDELNHINLVSFTNRNGLLINNILNVSSELLEFLDPTIESFTVQQSENNKYFHLKFRNGNQYGINEDQDLSLFLSSGTIKGLNVFLIAKLVLQKGGYLIIDEIENHFNKELVSVLIRFFMDETVNTGGGILLFSTHYAELLDVFERNDSIYITRNQGKITLSNLGDKLKRNDMKKSEIYQSSFLGGTAPNYESYLKLRKSFQKTTDYNEQ